MDRRTYIASVGVATTTLLAGCGGDGGDGGETTTTSGDIAATFVIDDSSVGELVKEVPVGATVRWESQDASVTAHQIVSGQLTDGATEWELNETVVEGGSFTHTFEEVGVYQFYSSTTGESGLCGAVVVGDAEMTGTLPCK